MMQIQHYNMFNLHGTHQNEVTDFIKILGQLMRMLWLLYKFDQT